MPLTVSRNGFSTVFVLSASIVLLAGFTVSTGLELGTVGNATVGPGADNLTVFNFTVTDGGDYVLKGVEPANGTVLARGQDSNWSISYYDLNDTDGNWNSARDFLAVDNDSDGVYTAQADFKLNGKDLNGGETLQLSKPVNWTNISFFNYTANGDNYWNSSADAIILENSTNPKFYLKFNNGSDTILAGNTSVEDTETLYQTKPSGWTTISFYNGSTLGWNASDDAIINDTGGNGTFSVGPDVNVTGTAPADGTAYNGTGAFSVNWTLASHDENDTDGGFNDAKDAIVFDNDNNSAYRDELNAVTFKNTGTADDNDITVLELWAENGDEPGFRYGNDTYVTNVTWGGDTWNASNLSHVIGPGNQTFYVTANVSAAALGMPTITLEIPALKDSNSDGDYDAGDEGLFLASTDDTGNITVNINDTQTVYTANITETETISNDSDSDTEQVVVRFSEAVNITDNRTGDGFPALVFSPGSKLNISSGDYSANNVMNVTFNLSDTVPDKSFKAGVWYNSSANGSIVTFKDGYILSEGNSSVTKIDGVNHAPTADAGGDRSVDEGDSIDIDCDDSTDPEEDSLTCDWVIPSGGDPTDDATIDGEGEGNPVSNEDTVTFDAPSVSGDTIVELKLTVEDPDGLTDSETIDITVENTVQTQQQEEDSGGGGGGGGGVAATGSSEPKTEETKSVVIGFGNSKKVDLQTEVLDSVDISAINDIIGDLTVTVSDDRPSSASSNPRGRVYKYLEVEKQDFSDEDVEKAVFGFRVEKSWISDNNIANETVALQRFNASWQKLNTTRESEDSDYVYYNATTPGFSAFAVTGEEAAANFSVSELNLSTASVKPGEEFNVSVTVKNTGNRKGNYSLELAFANQTLEKTFVDLRPGASVTASFRTSVDQPGNHTLGAGAASTTLTVAAAAGGVPWGTSAVFVMFLAVVVTVLFYVENEDFRQLVDRKVEPVRLKLEELLDREDEPEEEFSWSGF